MKKRKAPCRHRWGYNFGTHQEHGICAEVAIFRRCRLCYTIEDLNVEGTDCDVLRALQPALRAAWKILAKSQPKS
jgi:hypothetical protein